jgi:hypothetical protein
MTKRRVGSFSKKETKLSSFSITPSIIKYYYYLPS